MHAGGVFASRAVPNRWRAPRPLRRIAVAAVAATVAIVVSVGGNGGSGNLDPVARAADSTLRAGGAHMTLAMTLTVPDAGAPIMMEGSGYINEAKLEGDMSLRTTSLPASVAATIPDGALTIDAVFKGYTYYMRMPFLAGRLPSGKTWMKLDLATALKQSYGFSPTDLQNGTADPGQFLKMLKASHATAVGHAVLHGVPTTEYRGTVDLHSLIDRLPSGERAQAKAGIDKLIAQVGASTLPVEAWVDSSDHVRRIHTSVPMAMLGSSGGYDLTMDLFDFGTVEPVVVPPDSQVFDANGLVGNAVGAG
jgi:hypothetical protein